jgi:peptidoglycan-associated lipoprotein
MQIPLASIRSLQLFRKHPENDALPPYVAATNFRYSAAAVLEDGSRIEGDYINLGTAVLRGTAPQGRVDIPWQEIENVRFQPAAVAKTTEERVVPPPSLVEAPKPRKPVKGEISPLQDVFFDFDMSVLRDDGKAALNQNVAWLKAHPDTKVIVEGHADARGTNEYNLALGERRARAVRDYLVTVNIDPGRISIISYGEERPFVPDHDESSWKWNRRGHFVVAE